MHLNRTKDDKNVRVNCFIFHNSLVIRQHSILINFSIISTSCTAVTYKIIYFRVYFDTGYPHDGRADNTAYRHDRRADKRRYPHERESDIQMLKMSRNGYILS